MSLTEQREGIEAGRLDMFVDGAFAFTLTLLVIGGVRYRTVRRSCWRSSAASPRLPPASFRS
mgnify:CR=1 FL=1